MSFTRDPHAPPKTQPYPRIEISDISADISAIYRISAYSEAIFATENCLEEKSKKIGKYRRYFTDISVSDRNFGEISMSRTHARVTDFLLQNIGDISEISVKYRKYIRNICKNIGDISKISGYIGDISGYIGNISK